MDARQHIIAEGIAVTAEQDLLGERIARPPRRRRAAADRAPAAPHPTAASCAQPARWTGVGTCGLGATLPGPPGPHGPEGCRAAPADRR